MSESGISVYEARFGGLDAPYELRLRSATEERAELIFIWYCLLGRSRRASLEGGGVVLYVENDSVEPVRVWRKDIVRGFVKSSYAVAELRLLCSGAEMRFSEIVVVVDIEDLLRLCRDVRLSSNGFMSGGRFVIFLNVIARYADRKNDTKNSPPPTAAQ